MSIAASPGGLAPSMHMRGYDSGSEDGRRFLQERIALFGKVVFFLCTGFYIVALPLSQLSPHGDLSMLLDTPALAHLAACLMLAAIWQIGRRVTLGAHGLRLLDVGGTLLVCITYAFLIVGIEYTTTLNPAILAATNTLIARAITVPSSALRTFVVSLAASLPPVLTTWYTSSAGRLAASGEVPAWLEAAFAFVWMLVAVVGATVGSQVIYGLREEVREARRLGQYTLEEKIGAGGMGEVYRASHALLRRPTAIKLLPPERAGERNLARFEREVQLSSGLTHPNTVAIFDYGRTPSGVLYYAMEYLDGIDLDRLVREHGPQPASRVRRILHQVCGALAEAHGIGLIHRDIKPGNIILCERGGVPDVAKVVDFGLVKELDGVDPGISQLDSLTGTPLYMAPEMIRTSDAVDARTDLYSLGAVAYFLLSGHHVFEGNNLVEICGHHLHTPPVPLAERTSVPVPEGLDRLVLQCLEKDPEARPRDALELRDQLDACHIEPEWSMAEARVWWQRSDVHAGSAPAGPAAAGSNVRDAPTLEVDLSHRQGSVR